MTMVDLKHLSPRFCRMTFFFFFYSKTHINLRPREGIKTPATVFMMRRIYNPLPVMRHKFPAKLWFEPS